MKVQKVDIFGKVVRKELLDQGKSRYAINVGDLSEAVYVLRINRQNAMIRKKVVLLK
ncbi:T9SS type A sorting domain-containing protein [Bacteroidota bacterium]